MKMLLMRDQKKGILGGSVKFMLNARVELSEDEQANIKKYKMGKTMLYTNMEDRGAGLLGILSRFAMAIEITVNDLVGGKQVECKDIVEMLALEEQVKEACQTFKNVLDAAATFGGEEIVEF